MRLLSLVSLVWYMFITICIAAHTYLYTQTYLYLSFTWIREGMFLMLLQSAAFRQFLIRGNVLMQLQVLYIVLLWTLGTLTPNLNMTWTLWNWEILHHVTKVPSSLLGKGGTLNHWCGWFPKAIFPSFHPSCVLSLRDRRVAWELGAGLLARWLFFPVISSNFRLLEIKMRLQIQTQEAGIRESAFHTVKCSSEWHWEGFLRDKEGSERHKRYKRQAEEIWRSAELTWGSPRQPKQPWLHLRKCQDIPAHIPQGQGIRVS